MFYILFFYIIQHLARKVLNKGTQFYTFEESVIDDMYGKLEMYSSVEISSVWCPETTVLGNQGQTSLMNSRFIKLIFI